MSRLRRPAAFPFLCLLNLALPAAAQEADVKILPVTYYDFNAAHPDFQNAQCEGGKNMVQPALDSARKPFHLPGNTCAENRLADWFRSGPDNATYCRSLRMTRKAGTASTYEYHSDFFFPLDSVPTNENTYSAADGKTHNFHFCMEMKGTFKYKGGEVFDFLGDDDVWMYINNRLALDLGGIHGAQPGTVRLDERKAELGLEVGQYYPFDFFFCERQTGRSTMKVTTDLEIVPPTAGKVHISDARLSVLGAGDTLDLPKGGGPAVFKALQDWRAAQNVDCKDVITEGREPATGEWTLGGKALPAGSEVRVHPDSLPYGLHQLTFRKDAFTASVWIRVPGKPPIRAVGGHYQDRDGDGRIETAVIRFDTALGSLPQDLRFTDPFGKTAVAPLEVKATGPGELTAALPPFHPGTGFEAAALASLGASPEGFAAEDIILADSVGPVLLEARAFPASPGAAPALEVRFSEPVPLPAAPLFPFDLKRGDVLLDPAAPQVTHRLLTAQDRWRLTFLAGPPHPVPGDSLRILASAALPDARGARSLMRFFIPVTGDPLRVTPDIRVSLLRGVNDAPPLQPKAGKGLLVVHGGGVCANCDQPALRPLLFGTPVSAFAGLGPTWEVKTLFPFRYVLKVFDNLGHYVNAAEGEVGPDAFAAMRSGTASGDSVRIRLTLLPLGGKGQVLATGAYVVRGTVAIRPQAGLRGPQGEPAVVTSVERTFTSRFGYLRKP